MSNQELKTGISIDKFISDISNGFDFSTTIHNSNTEVSFDIKSSFEIIKRAVKITKNEPTVLQIDAKAKNSDFVIVGDLHGSLESLLLIFEKKGTPQTTPYLFLGDYVDRGPRSCEVIMLLYSYKVLYPENIFLIRGNHEFRYINDTYGFKQECLHRVKKTINGKIISKGDKFFKEVTKTFKYLPLCAIVNDHIFCVHGGITSFLSSRRELMRIEKVFSKSTLGLNGSVQTEFLWNDPDPRIQTVGMNSRLLGHTFGKKILNDFLNALNFNLVIRGHQMEVNGFNWPFGENGGMLTVFSAPNYWGGSNSTAIAVVKNDDKVEICQFKWEPPPNPSLGQNVQANLDKIRFMYFYIFIFLEIFKFFLSSVYIHLSE